MNTATRIGVEELRQSAIECPRLNDLGHHDECRAQPVPTHVELGRSLRRHRPGPLRRAAGHYELRTLLAAQWSTGMIPHIVFSENYAGYFPGVDRWGTASAAARPAGVKSSGICQPPVHAIAVRHIVDRGRENGGPTRKRPNPSCANRSTAGWRGTAGWPTYGTRMASA